MIITGRHGFIGQRALEQLGGEALPGELLYQDFETEAARERLKAWVLDRAPEVIVHTAAISDIGQCEKRPEDSRQANVLLPEVLAEAANRCGAKLICFSSDQVYTGLTEEGPYAEDMPLPSPANIYARHKLEAEARVLTKAPEAVMLRATWMYDLPMYGHPNRGNFLVNTIKTALVGEAIRVGVQYRGITYARQVVSLLPLAAKLPGGVYNYGSENPLTMQETAQALLDAWGLRAPIICDGQIRHNLWMDCRKLAAQGVVFDTTAQGFVRAAADYGFAR